jgi:hypothetical protein
MLRYKIGRRPTPIDDYLSYQILQNMLFFVSYLIWIPYLTITRHSTGVLATAFVIDVLITFVIASLTVMRTRRWDVLSAFPQVYAFRWVSLAVFMRAFVEVIVLRKFRNSDGLWENHSTRRYIVDTVELKA